MSDDCNTNAPGSVVVIGGGLAGIAAALECADRGAQVVLIERRNWLGGLTWSFERDGLWIDNGQHVFLRCCTEYISFLERIGASTDIEMPARLDVPVAAPGDEPAGPPRIGRLRRARLPAPFHLAGALARYPHISAADRLRLGRAVLGLYRLDLDNPDLDEVTFGEWLATKGQATRAVRVLWDLITVPTVNLPAAEASLAMGAKVFKTGLLSAANAADIGWSRVPLGRLHGKRAAVALGRAGVDVRLGTRVVEISSAGPIHRGAVSWPDDQPAYTVTSDGGTLPGDAVVLAVPHQEAMLLLPPDAIADRDRLGGLGQSAIVDVHLIFDRRVTDWPLMAGVESPIQWVFDRTASSGLQALEAPDRVQYLAISLSSADELMGQRPEQLVAWATAELARLLPAVRTAKVVDSVVTKERNATFRATPGSGALRPGPATRWPGLALAGAWTDTGWPATMEGAVRSGRAAALAVLPPDPPTPISNRQLEPIEEVA